MASFTSELDRLIRDLRGIITTLLPAAIRNAQADLEAGVSGQARLRAEETLEEVQQLRHSIEKALSRRVPECHDVRGQVKSFAPLHPNLGA